MTTPRPPWITLDSVGTPRDSNLPRPKGSNPTALQATSLNVARPNANFSVVSRKDAAARTKMMAPSSPVSGAPMTRAMMLSTTRTIAMTSSTWSMNSQKPSLFPAVSMAFSMPSTAAS